MSKTGIMRSIHAQLWIHDHATQLKRPTEYLLLRSLNLKYLTYVLVLKTKLLFVKCYYMLCSLPRYLLFRFNMTASSARIPRIFNHKRMLTSYLMAVSSNLIKEIFDTIHCLELYCYSQQISSISKCGLDLHDTW